MGPLVGHQVSDGLWAADCVGQSCSHLARMAQVADDWEAKTLCDGLDGSELPGAWWLGGLHGDDAGRQGEGRGSGDASLGEIEVEASTCGGAWGHRAK